MTEDKNLEETIVKFDRQGGGGDEESLWLEIVLDFDIYTDINAYY